MASSEVGTYLRNHEALIVPLHRDYSLCVWDLSLSGNDPNLERALVAAKERYLKVYNNREDFAQLKRWKAADLCLDEVTARQFKLIYDGFVPNQIEPDVLRDIVQRETQIENLFNTFRANFEGDKSSDNQLREILRTEQDPSRRRAAWEASKQIGREVASQLLELISIRNGEARKLGYDDYYSMMFQLQELDEKWVFSLFDRLEELSEQAFVSVKTELDRALRAKYGIPEKENYPWLYGDPFFQEFPGAGSMESLDDVFKDADIEALTRAHYTHTRTDAVNRAATLVANLKAYQQANGAYPDSLDVFGDSAMTRDPFTGQRFAYRNNGGDFQLYSLGRNGQDDGGVHDPKGDTNDIVYWPRQPKQ